LRSRRNHIRQSKQSREEYKGGEHAASTGMPRCPTPWENTNPNHAATVDEVGAFFNHAHFRWRGMFVR
jgi:hypothetical protein